MHLQRHSTEQSCGVAGLSLPVVETATQCRQVLAIWQPVSLGTLELPSQGQNRKVRASSRSEIIITIINCYSDHPNALKNPQKLALGKKILPPAGLRPLGGQDFSPLG